MTITIKDIARFAGVSVGTASKVINQKGSVSPELKMRVEAVVEKLQFRPSALARNVKQQRTQIIGLIVPQIVNSFYVQVVDIIERAINQHGYVLFLGKSDEDMKREIQCLRKFSDMRVEGLMLASSGVKDDNNLSVELESYRNLNIPVVLLVRSMKERLFDTVVLDNINGSYKATRHLIERGHERIAIISSSSRTTASQERIDGYIKAVQEFGLALEPALIHVGGWTLDSGYEITKKIMTSLIRTHFLWQEV